MYHEQLLISRTVINSRSPTREARRANHSSGQATAIKIFKFLVRVLRPFHLAHSFQDQGSSIKKSIQISSQRVHPPAKVTETRYVLCNGGKI